MPGWPHQQLSFRTLCRSEALARDRTILRVSFMAADRPRPRPPSPVQSTSGKSLRRRASPGAGPESPGAGPDAPLVNRREGGTARAQWDGPTSGTGGLAPPLRRRAGSARARGTGFAACGQSCIRVREKGDSGLRESAMSWLGRQSLRCESLRMPGSLGDVGEDRAASVKAGSSREGRRNPRGAYACRNPSSTAYSGSSSLSGL